MKTHRLAVAASALLAAMAQAQEADDNPDFTQGGTIPANAKHDWNLGATGARGWMFTDEFATKAARQIKITAVAAGSPAHRVLQVGDVLLGVGGSVFAYDPRTEFGKALTQAESDAGRGNLVLKRWRDGAQEDVTLQLAVLGTYAATAPFACQKSNRVFERGCELLAKRMTAADYDPDRIVRSLDALALLASGRKEYRSLLAKEASRAAEFVGSGFRSWYYGYVMLFLAEYTLATGDDSVLPGLRRLALDTAKGQSAVGSWGHDFARPDGRLRGYGMMNSPGLPLTIALAMARAAGVKDPEVEHAIARSLRLLRFHVGKGSVPYGDHAPWMEGHEDNGKCAMAAVLFHLTGEATNAAFFARMTLAAHGGERDCGHTGNYFNMLWAMPGVALSGPAATGAWMHEFGAWYFDLARTWDGGFAHQGPPDFENDSYEGWDATGAYLLAHALPKKSLWLTGKRASSVPQLDAAQAELLIAPGRGWTQGDGGRIDAAKSDDELFALLGSWSPILRSRASKALARRKPVPVARVQALLASPSLDARLGACQAIAEFGPEAAAAVPALRELLAADDLWLSVKAAEALAAIGKAAAPALPELLERIARPLAIDDPRGMHQRHLVHAVFRPDGGLLGQALEHVDRQQLRRAVQAGLENEDGSARGAIASVYLRLSFEELEPLFPAILQAVVVSAPSGEMFADEVRIEGLRVLAKHHVADGIAACADYIRDQNPWASEHRTPKLLAILAQYGAHAQAVLPQLEAIAADFADGEIDFPAELSKQKAAAVREAIQKLAAATARPQLRRVR
jgi:HEAT repeat protein